MSTLALFGLQNIGPLEGLVILAFGLLLFGKRLPEVGRSLGKGIVEFKRGLKGVADDIETESSKAETAPKRELPEAKEASENWAKAPPAEEVRVSRSEKVE
jgi:sec-independent protein translocase protein TatA